MDKFKVFIINYDHLTWPKLMAEYISVFDNCEPIFIDNNSTYPPLLEWYKSCPYKVVKLDKNLGHLSPWESGIIEELADQYYVVTDSDLDLAGIPADCVWHLIDGLKLYPDIYKCGLGIEYRGIPEDDIVLRDFKRWQSRWANPAIYLGNGFYKARVDTTFAVYDKQRPMDIYGTQFLIKAIRADRPYWVRHIPYYIREKDIDEEYRYYLEHCLISECTVKRLRSWSQ